MEPVVPPLEQPKQENKPVPAPIVVAQIFSYDTTIYHNEHEPKALKAGSPVPEGWTTEPGTLKVSWKNNIDGSWIKTAVK